MQQTGRWQTGGEVERQIDSELESAAPIMLRINAILPSLQEAADSFDPNETIEDRLDAVFYRTDPLLYHKFENIVIYRSGNLYWLSSPGNQHYQKIIYLLIFHQKGRNHRSKFDKQKIYQLDYITIH